MSLTKEEKKEIEDIFNISIYSTEYYPHETFSDLFERKLTEWLEQKKKQWMELAVAEYKLKKEMETKFYTSGSGDNWRWKCIRCGTEGGLYDAHYGVIGGYVCNNCDNKIVRAY